jgi:hypothetical protein
VPYSITCTLYTAQDMHLLHIWPFIPPLPSPQLVCAVYAYYSSFSNGLFSSCGVVTSVYIFLPIGGFFGSHHCHTVIVGLVSPQLTDFFSLLHLDIYPPPLLSSVTLSVLFLSACVMCILFLSISVFFIFLSCAGIFKQSMRARNLVGIGLSFRPARLHRLAELVPWNRFLGSLKV